MRMLLLRTIRGSNYWCQDARVSPFALAGHVYREVGRACGMISKSSCLCTANAERVLAWKKKCADGILRVLLALDMFF